MNGFVGPPRTRLTERTRSDPHGAHHHAQVRDPKDCIRRRLPAEEVRDRDLHLRPVHVGRRPYPGADCFVVPINDRPEGYDYPAEVRFEIEEQEVDSYLRAADFLNFANTDIVSLQHEYGIFGGPAGSHVVGLLRDLRMPIVTTLHTVLREPTAEQRRVLTQVADLSARLVVMSERARTFLREIYDVPDAKIDLIAHGIPDMPFVDPNSTRISSGSRASSSR